MSRMLRHPLRSLQGFTLLAAGVYGLFVVLGNVIDPASNLSFVAHVMSMDTTFEDNALLWRAVAAPAVHVAVFVVIVVAEAVFTVLALIGAVQLLRRRDADRATFDRARAWGFAAYGVGILLWFVGFIVIGSEWFAMWQSSTWNGKDTAMDLTLLWVALAVLLALNEPATSSEERRV